MFKSFFDDQQYLQGDIKLQNLQINSEIGRGNSVVYLGILNQSNVAIKQTQIKSDYQYQNFLQEISILKSLSQSTDCVIKYQGYFVTSTKTNSYNNKKYGYLLMQRAQMNLFQLIKEKRESKTRVGIDHIITTTNVLLSGFSYLQSVNIAHCDIKPQNILVTSSSPFKVKICDVGSCKMISKDAQSQATIKGTLSFLAPQLIRIQTSKITSINPFRSDVYSFGLVLLYMITGKKFNSVERKQVSQQVYHQVINEWIKLAGEILNEEYCIVDIVKKALEFDQYKRPLFKELKTLYQLLIKKKKSLRQNKVKKLSRKQVQNESIQTKKQTLVISEQPQKTKLPQIKISNSTTLISFHSRKRLTGKISSKNTKSPMNKKSSEKSNEKSKRQNDRSKSRISPFQKTTMYSTFSIDKSKISILNEENTKVIQVTNQNYNMIPYESIFQQDKIFVLFNPNILFQSAQSVVIKKQCSIEVFDKLSTIKSATNFYLQYPQIEVFGPDQNTPTIQSFESVYINLQNSIIEGGYNNLLRCLCPFTLKNLHLQLTGSQITFQEVRSQIERIKNKQLTKLDFCWDKAPINFQSFAIINQKISKLPLKKLILSFGSSYLKPAQKSRWPLPPKCKILYLNFPNNFLGEILGNLSLSLSQQTQMKQFYLNLQNNSLTDIDIKVLTKSLKRVQNLQKAILNFSFNHIEKGRYCFEQMTTLNKISSLQLRISKCGIKFDQFQQIISLFISLFHSSLKILKLIYDRNVSKGTLYSAIQKIVKDQFNQGLKIDIFGHDYSYYMIYLKKKSQAVQKSIKIKAKNSSNHVLPSKLIDTSTNLGINRSISNNLNIQNNSRMKQQQDQFIATPGLKQGNSDKNIVSDKTCEAFYSTYPTYQCYICLGCIQNKETAKFQYFCRACIQSCEHKGHNIVRTYQKKVCNCPYNHKCYYNNNLSTCADKLGIKYKKEYECQKCSPNKSVCQGCIAQCQQAHPQWVQSKSSGYFQCSRQFT